MDVWNRFLVSLVAVLCIPMTEALAEAPSRVIRHSDVVFMYDNPELYTAYGCTVLGWAGSRAPERIALAHQRGVRHFAVSIGFRTEFAGMIDFTPQFMDATCRNFAGEPFIVPWLWDHKHKGQPAWWFCTNSPLYRAYLYQRLEEVVRSGADGLHIDDYTGTAGAVTWLDACFCPACMEGFRQYLRDHLSEEKRRDLKLGNLDTFDYRQFLSAQGITPERYHRERGKLPLAAEFLDFQVKAVTNFVAEFRKKGESLKGGPLPLAVNSGLIGPMNLAITPHLDYFCCEVDHRAGERKVPRHPIYVYKLADGLDRPVTSTASGGDWAYIMEHNLPGLVRTWVALSYAFGHNFMAPHRQWCYTQEKGTHWYSGKTEEYAPIYQFVRQNAALLDDFEAATAVAIVYDNTSQRQGKGNIEGIATALAEANIPFTVCVQGDDWLPGYAVREQDVDGVVKLIVPKDLQPGEELAKVLEYAKAKGKVVVWDDPTQAVQQLPKSVEVSVPGMVFAVPRIKKTSDGAEFVLHLVNRQYDGQKDRMVPPQDLRVVLDKGLLPQPSSTYKQAVIHQFGKPPVTVGVSVDGDGRLSCTIPELDLWAILEFRP